MRTRRTSLDCHGKTLSSLAGKSAPPDALSNQYPNCGHKTDPAYHLFQERKEADKRRKTWKTVALTALATSAVLAVLAVWRGGHSVEKQR